MSKDRAAPFSRKHRRYWLPVTGGMILIGALNVTIGYCAYDPPPPPPQKIELVIPPPSAYQPAAGTGRFVGGDAGIDAAPAGAAPPVAVPPSATVTSPQKQ